MTNKEKYNAIAHKLPLFFKPWWLDAACHGSWDVAITEQNGQITAVWPYQLERKWGLKITRNPLLTPYLGPYFFPAGNSRTGMQLWDWEEEQVKLLLEQLPQQHYLQFSTPPRFDNFLPFLHKGISSKNRLTYYIDLKQTEESLLEKVQKRRRRYIRNADEQLRIADGAFYLPDFFVMHRDTFTQKKASYPYNIPFFEKVMAAANQQKSSKFWAVVDSDNHLCAALWVVYDETTMYQLLSCFPKNSEHPHAMTLLTWHAIIEAKKLGLTVFDFEGSIEKGIESFFRKFGGERIPYLEFEQYHSRLWKLKKSLLG